MITIYPPEFEISGPLNANGDVIVGDNVARDGITAVHNAVAYLSEITTTGFEPEETELNIEKPEEIKNGA